MCRAVRCGQCNKVGWAGCGAHVEQVLAGVPEDERCKCREAAARPPIDLPPAGERAKQ